MTHFCKLLTSFAAIVFASVWLNTAHAEVLKNDTVILLTKAGSGQDSIIAKIKSSTAQFDLSTEQLIKLKQAKVHDLVIAAMVQAGSRIEKASVSDSPDPSVMRAAGIYVLRDWETPSRCSVWTPPLPRKPRINPLLSAVTYGIAKVKIHHGCA